MPLAFVASADELIMSKMYRRLAFETLDSRVLFHAAPAGEPAEPLANFSLVDVNPNSSSFNQSVSPAQYEGRVSAWFFAFASCTYCKSQFAALDAITAELENLHPVLKIDAVGVNAHDKAFANPAFVEDRSLPWLQTEDNNGDGNSDAWQSWDVNFRDLVIRGGDGERIATFNLATHDLTEFNAAQELRALLVDTAMVQQRPYHNAGTPLDIDANGSITPLDALLVIIELNSRGGRKLEPPTVTSIESFIDSNGDGLVSPLDALLVINQLNSALGYIPSGEPLPDKSAANPNQSSSEWCYFTWLELNDD